MKKQPFRFDLIKAILNSRKARIFRLLNAQPDNPKHKALSITTGIYLGFFPVIGATTVLSLIVSFVFRLNHFLVQGLNLLLAPVHLAVILPVLKAGRWLFFGDGHVISAISFQHGISLEAFQPLFESVAGGIVLWAIVAAVTSPGVYFLILKIVERQIRETVQNQ
jgi:uncharacterized protein (DUF2062 family)